ncbi:hypothetical protein H5410_005242, partial [Solanum commersonii]
MFLTSLLTNYERKGQDIKNVYDILICPTISLGIYSNCSVSWKMKSYQIL